MLQLREIEAIDLPTITAWRNDREILAGLGNNFLYIASAVDEAWYAQYLAHRHQAVRLAILTPNSDTLIGLINLTGIEPINRSAALSVLIGSAANQGKGFGTEATRMMLRHGFEDLNLHRIHLGVLRDNERAIRLYQKVGFTLEGTAREAIYKDGDYGDLLQMSMLRREYDRLCGEASASMG